MKQNDVIAVTMGLILIFAVIFAWALHKCCMRTIQAEHQRRQSQEDKREWRWTCQWKRKRKGRDGACIEKRKPHSVRQAPYRSLNRPKKTNEAASVF
ncbi:hypothetical protein BDV95DRAFT_613276 [Massariosphaeria phaeospora]|uniref:Uncharacterized protein n=1 Tax=Massariosphaeria phaeospora TaxID=100035 RepID=A0A7C8M113_9PLEO|nr:hypothetical protein BDV95DRAFT_613276 [Massariosphaeria phaeospora]